MMSIKAENLISYLARGIDDLGGELLAFMLDDLTECILDRRVVAFHEVAINKLYCK